MKLIITIDNTAIVLQTDSADGAAEREVYNLNSGISIAANLRQAPAADAPAAEGKTRKSTKAPARRGRPPLAPELYVEMGGEQYNITDIIDRAKADYRTTHKVGVQSCKVYVKPEEGAAYYVINKFSGKLEL